MPVGRAMGEWLADTLEAAEFTAQKMQEAREAPALVTRELQAYALGLGDETVAFLAKLREKGRAARTPTAGRRRAAAQTGLFPPSSNTGGKGTETPHTKRKPK